MGGTLAPSYSFPVLTVLDSKDRFLGEAGMACITCSVSLTSLHAHDCRKLYLMIFLPDF